MAQESDPHFSTELLHTKFEIPNLAQRIVRRSRLTAELLKGADKKVSLIVAPAGYGKTTLLCEWLSLSAKSNNRIAWITFDLFDNAPFRFWSYVIAALKKAAPQFKYASQDLHFLLYDPSDFTKLNPLINEIGRLPYYFNLVLDDFHVISNDAILKSIVYFFDHQPRNLHIIISSRTKPSISFAKLRISGRCTELNIQDLAFTVEETGAYLSNLGGHALPMTRISELHQVTMGWIAGLQLAAFSMLNQPHNQPDLLTELYNHGEFPDYFSEEVLAHQDPEIQEFLLNTSILNDFSVPLCNFLLKKGNSHEIIDRLLEQDLFIVSIDREKQWFRYHPLFANALQKQLLKRKPESLLWLHQTAMEWLLDNGYLEKAINHALQTNNLSKAAEILDSVALEAIVNHNLTKLIHWIDSNPDTFLDLRPSLGIYYATAYFLTGQRSLVVSSLEKTEQVLARMGDSTVKGEDKEVLAWDIQALRAAVRIGNENTPQNLSSAERLISDESKQSRYLFGLLATTIGITYDQMGQFSKALPLYQKGIQLARENDFPFGYFQTKCAVALLFFKQGLLNKSILKLEQVSLFAKQKNLGQSSILLVKSFLLEIALEQNKANQANAIVDEMTDLFNQLIFNDSDWINFVNYALSMADYFVFRMDLAQANHYFRLAADKCPKHIKPPSFLFPIDPIEVYVRIKRAEMQSLNKTTWYEGADEFINKETLKTIPGKIVQMRIFLDQHKYEEAIRFFHTFYKQVEQTSFTWWKLELKTLLALSYYATKRESKAFPLIHDVLQFASNQEVIRIFVNEREPMRSLLCDYMEWVDHEKIGLNQASSDYLKKLMPALDLHCAEGGTIKKEQSPTTISIFPMEEPFSPKEEEIFALLYQGKSAKEIAEIMGVSINTTRTHTKNIYRKFGVHSQKLLIKRAKELEFEG